MTTLYSPYCVIVRVTNLMESIESWPHGIDKQSQDMRAAPLRYYVLQFQTFNKFQLLRVS